MRSLAIVDSGPLIAAVNEADPYHAGSVALLESLERDLVISSLCIAEVTYLLGKRLGAHIEALFLASLEGSDVQSPKPEDWPRIGSLVERFADLPLGGTDASVLVLAERLEADEIISLDRRHFSVIESTARVIFPERSAS